MNTDWFKRNWPLAIVAGILLLMIVKKTITKLSTIDTPSVNGDISHSYLWVIAVAIVVAIIWGNKIVRNIGWIGAATMIYFFGGDITEYLINFDPASTQAGKAVEKKWGDASWIYVPLAIIVLFFIIKFSGKTVDKITTIVLGFVAALAIIWVVMAMTGADEKVLKINQTSFQTAGCTDTSDLSNRNNTIYPNLPKCIGIRADTNTKLRLKLKDSRDILDLSFTEQTCKARPDLCLKFGIYEILIPKPQTNGWSMEYEVSDIPREMGVVYIEVMIEAKRL